MDIVLQHPQESMFTKLAVHAGFAKEATLYSFLFIFIYIWQGFLWACRINCYLNPDLMEVYSEIIPYNFSRCAQIFSQRSAQSFCCPNIELYAQIFWNFVNKM